MVRFETYYINRTNLIAELENRRIQLLQIPEEKCRLAIRKNGTRYQCFKTGDGKDEYVSNNQETINTLAESTVSGQFISIVSSYLHRMDKLQKSLEKEIKQQTNSWENKTIVRIKKLYPDLYMKILKSIFPNSTNQQIMRLFDPNNWIHINGQRNKFHEEQLIYRTNDGVLMRTKSEIIWGNHLEKRGILYAYEPELIIGNMKFYPDFVLIKPDGTLVIIEHCGLIDNPEYLARTQKKVEAYRQAGFVQNKNLVLTYEADIRSTNSLDEILLRFYYI